ncbi:MAG: O-antigen ligase family protein, partial [Polyangiales bacterium]
MAILGALVLVVVLLLRPMELVPAIAKLRPLETLTAITLLGIGYEATTRRTKIGVPPQLPWLAAFLAWAFFATSAKLGSKGFGVTWTTVALAAIFMVLVSFAAVSRDRLRAMCAVLAASLAVISAVAVHQGLQPRQCIEIVQQPDEDEEWFPDGRECEGARTCEQNGKEGADYTCERVGLLGTFSVAGRVRYRGQLGDPNELSVFVGAGLPLVFFLAAGRKRLTQVLIVGPVLAISLWAVVLSQSRTGQVVLGTIALIALIRKFGLKGLLFAIAMSPGFLLLGGREGAEADASSLERATILYEGIDLVRAHPFLGVGASQFGEEISIPMTAHNSYLLAAAELGIMGLVLWAGMLWTSMKVAVVVATDPPPGVDRDLVLFAEALAVSLAAIFVGIFFLSFCYKQLLFVWLGLAAALHGAVRAQAPNFRVRTTGREIIGLVAFSVVILSVI